MLFTDRQLMFNKWDVQSSCTFEKKNVKIC